MTGYQEIRTGSIKTQQRETRMMRQKRIYRFSILLLLTVGPTASALAQEHVIIPRFGAVERNTNTNQRVDNNTFDFDSDTVAAPGFLYLYKLDNGVAIGAEVFAYENEIITTANNNGDVRTGHIYGVLARHFKINNYIMPYIGLGAGLVSMKFDGNVNGAISDDNGDNATGLSYELIAGAEFVVDKNIGFVVEYKYFDFKVDDDIDDRNIEIESDGRGLFFGVALHL